VSYGFGLTIEAMVAILLLLTILYCARLNKQIGRLKADERLMKTTVADLMAATEKAERAIAGLKTTVKEADNSLGARLREAEGYCASLTDNLRAGEDLLIRLRKIAYANNLLGGEVPVERPVQAAPTPANPPPPAPEPAHDAKSVAAAAQAFADRARARAQAQTPRDHVPGKAA
jgi:hypothetical protein